MGMHGRRGHGSSRVRGQVSKRWRADRKERWRDRRRRDKLITETYGRRGHRMCGRKVRYDTPEMAQIASMNVSSSANIGFRTYRCPICGGWHITKTGEHARGNA